MSASVRHQLLFSSLSVCANLLDAMPSYSSRSHLHTFEIVCVCVDHNYWGSKPLIHPCMPFSQAQFHQTNILPATFVVFCAQVAVSADGGKCAVPGEKCVCRPVSQCNRCDEFEMAVDREMDDPDWCSGWWCPWSLGPLYPLVATLYTS